MRPFKLPSYQFSSIFLMIVIVSFSWEQNISLLNIVFLRISIWIYTTHYLWIDFYSNSLTITLYGNYDFYTHLEAKFSRIFWLEIVQSYAARLSIQRSPGWRFTWRWQWRSWNVRSVRINPEMEWQMQRNIMLAATALN